MSVVDNVWTDEESLTYVSIVDFATELVRDCEPLLEGDELWRGQRFAGALRGLRRLIENEERGSVVVCSLARDEVALWRASFEAWFGRARSITDPAHLDPLEARAHDDLTAIAERSSAIPEALWREWRGQSAR